MSEDYKWFARCCSLGCGKDPLVKDANEEPYQNWFFSEDKDSSPKKKATVLVIETIPLPYVPRIGLHNQHPAGQKAHYNNVIEQTIYFSLSGVTWDTLLETMIYRAQRCCDDAPLSVRTDEQYLVHAHRGKGVDRGV